MTKKFFIEAFGLLEQEVSKNKFIEIERFCDFYPKIQGETATDGFSYSKRDLVIKGRVT